MLEEIKHVTDQRNIGAYYSMHIQRDIASHNQSGSLASKTGMGTYTYDANHKHAVASTGVSSYQYDQNGSQTKRITASGTYTLTYDAESRMVGVSGAVTASFTYGGDGSRVQGVVSETTVLYVGSHYEWSGSTGTKYYYAGGTRVAMRAGSTLSWLFGDHLGSTGRVANADGSPHSEQRYKAWGEKRYPDGASPLPTTYRYTGQREEQSLSIYFYGARWYDPSPSQVSISASTTANVLTGNPFGAYRDSTLAGQISGGGTPDLNNWLVGTMTANAAGPIAATLNNANSGGLDDKYAAYLGWAAMVKGGAPWDYKNDLSGIDSVILGSSTVPMDVAANVHYGFVGSASGFSGSELLAGAGVAQIAGGSSRFSYWNSNFDDPRDQLAIWIGIMLYKKYGVDLTVDQFIQALDQNNDDLQTPQ